MTLQEILNMISLKYPHSYGNSDIITMINDIQRRIFRTMYKPITEVVYDLLADQPQYPLSFSADGIVDVVVNGKPYPDQNIKYDAQDYYYYALEDRTLGIYPTPKETVTRGLTVFHYMEPKILSSMNDAPDLDPSWHMLLVLHVCKDLAAFSDDDRGEMMTRRFTQQINEIERQFTRSKQARPHRIKDVYGVGQGAY